MSGFISAGGRRLTGKRMVVVLGACIAACAAVAIVAPLIGVVAGPHGRSLDLLGLDAFDDPLERTILNIRFARVGASMLVGAALAAAGCALQALLRNPLAEPYTLGISSGSALAAVVAIRFGVEQAFGDLGVTLATMAGATLTLAIVWRLARIGQQLPPATLILAGVTLSMFCSAASLLIQVTADFSELQKIMRWTMGNLDSMRLHTVQVALAPIAIGLVILVAFGRTLNALAAGPEAAASVGVSVGRTQTIVFIVASFLVGISIAVAGPIGFVGLVVPHALRAMIGPDHRLLMLASMFGGAILLAVCDTLARTVHPSLLPTGAVTAVLGGPFFLYVLVRQKQHAAMWGR